MWLLRAIIGLAGTVLVLLVALFIYMVGATVMTGDNLSTPDSRIAYAALVAITLLVGVGGVALVWRGVLRLWKS